MKQSATLRDPPDDVNAGTQPDAELHGVRGWLLALCLMLTVAGPAISVWLMASAYGDVAPSRPLGVQASVLASLLLSACAVAFGAYAGVRLWRIRPNAVATTKHALLFGLAVDVITTTLEVAAAAGPDDRSLFQVEIGLVPSLVFFTLCFAYLDRSRRVHATYASSRTPC